MSVSGLERLREQFDAGERSFHSTPSGAALIEWALENGEALLDIAEAAQNYVTATSLPISPLTRPLVDSGAARQRLKTALASLDSTAGSDAEAELANWPRVNDGTYLKIPRSGEVEGG